MKKKPPPHLYIELLETRRRLKSLAALFGVAMSGLAEDAAQDLLRDLEEVPPGVTGPEVRRFLSELRWMRRERYRRGPLQDT